MKTIRSYPLKHISKQVVELPDHSEVMGVRMRLRDTLEIIVAADGEKLHQRIFHILVDGETVPNDATYAGYVETPDGPWYIFFEAT